MEQYIKKRLLIWKYSTGIHQCSWTYTAEILLSVRCEGISECSTLFYVCKP